MIPFKSVKFRLTLWYAAVLTIFLSIFSFLMYAELSRALHRDVDQRLLFESGSIEDSLKTYLDDHLNKTSFKPGDARSPYTVDAKTYAEIKKNVLEWQRSTRQLGRSSLFVKLLGFDHALILSNLRGWEKEVIFPDFERDNFFLEHGTSFQTIHFQRKPIRLYYDLFEFQGYSLFVIQCGVPLIEVKNTLQRLTFIILITIPGAVAAACFFGWLLAKRFFQPLDSMIREARKITAAYLKGRLPRSHVGDELDRLAETLNEMMDRIESSTRAVQDFSSDVSHELRTPLAIIRGEIDLALRRSRTPEALVETLKVIEGEVNELIRLVDDLILLVRSDASQLRFQMKKISLPAILNQVISRFQDRLLSKHHAFTVDLGPETVLMTGDEIYLKRLFSNLLDNAIKFTPDKGKVKVSLHRRDDFCEVEISDTGFGIESEMQEKVFSRFYRTDQARSYEGSGLGLNIAKTICQAHGGTIQIQSLPGKGTRVTVKLPLNFVQAQGQLPSFK